VAYVVASGDERPRREELSEFLGAFLPEQLLPSKYVWLDELPLTAHGKVDRQALPAPMETPANPAPAIPGAADPAGAINSSTAGVTNGVTNGAMNGGADEGRERTTATEAAIAPVLSELLDVAEIGSRENFFLLGGHSMLGAQLIVRLEKLFDVEITLRFLFDHPTLAEIAAEVDRQMANAVVAGSSIG
jgi:acyl carrier protein